MSFGFSVGDFLAALELARRIRQQWIDAPLEYASLRAETSIARARQLWTIVTGIPTVYRVRNIENILRGIVELVEEAHISSRLKGDLDDALTSCVEILSQTDEIVKKYSSLQNNERTLTGRAKRSWRRFRVDPDDIRHLRDQLTATVTHLGAIQNNIEIEMVQDLTGDIDEMRTTNKQQRKAEIADWFATANFAEQQSDQLARRHAGTADWFLQSKQYTSWRQGVKETLYCPGIPGSGKTIIAATVVDDLRQHFADRKDVIIVYFYCSFQRQPEQSFDNILAALVRQLFQEKPNIIESVDNLYRSHVDRGTRPSADALISLLRTLAQSYSKVFILVDALDECSNNDRSREKLLDKLFNLQGQASVDVNLFFTSRLVPEISAEFRNTPRLDIAAQKQDVEIYLDGRMPELCSGVRNNQSLQEDIKAKIVASVNGMFLLARLHFESLQDKMTPKAVQRALDKLPEGPQALFTAYEEAMERINQQPEGFRLTAQKVLAWAVFSRQQLSIIQLQEAIAIEPDMDDIDYETDLVDAHEMISVCAGLVTVDKGSMLVRLVHYTTQQFFERTKDKWLPGGERLVAESCLHYLRMKVFDPIPTSYLTTKDHFEKDHTIFQKHKLLQYVGAHWGFHATSILMPEEYVSVTLCDHTKLVFVSQLIHMDRYNPPAHEKVSSIHICAFFNNTKAASFLLKKEHEINQIISRDETPLLWATESGHKEMVELLLAHPDINVNLGAPLRIAAYYGHVKIVKLFLERSDIDANLGIPISWSAVAADKKVVQQFISRSDVDVNAGKTLSWAAIFQHNDIIKLLLARPDIDVNLGVPLSWAAFSGNGDVVKLFLARDDVDVNAGKPLTLAVIGGHKDIVELFLARSDVDVNYGEPLLKAIRHNQVEIAKLLLARPDVDVNLGSPLTLAAAEGNKEVVELFLARKDIDINLGNPLSWATYFGHGEIMAMLKARPEIDVKPVEPLSSAAESGYRKVVELVERKFRKTSLLSSLS